MNALISKNRKPKFELNLKIYDLNNVPLVNGTSFVKWHLPSSSSADHRGRTSKSPVHDHAVVWDYSKTLQVRLTTDKTNMLQELLIHFEIVQDYGSGVRGSDKITLGNIALNLAEYVEGSDGAISPGGKDGEDEGIVRRHLMQDSKINSTLKIGISMKQIDGERNFVAPPLKTAPVFGGIAGIMGQEQGEADEVGHMPSINRSREAGELQDVYRRSLAAFWAAQAGELPADQCIEDIFAGGDGWRSKNSKDKILPAREHLHPGHQGEDGEDEERWQSGKGHSRNVSSGSTNSRHTSTARNVGEHLAHRINKSRDSSDIKELNRHHAVYASQERENESHHQHTHHHHHHQHHHNHHRSHGHMSRTGSSNGFRNAQEVDEFDVRDDLKSWQIPGRKVLEEKAP